MIMDSTFRPNSFGSKRMLIVLDDQNTRAAAAAGRTPYEALVRLICDEMADHELVDCRVHIGVPPPARCAVEEAAWSRARKGVESVTGWLRRAGFFVCIRQGKYSTPRGDAEPRYSADIDVAMAVDVMRVVNSSKIDSVVICSGDADFVPVAEYLRTMGIRVVVAAAKNQLGELRKFAQKVIVLDPVLSPVEPAPPKESLLDALVTARLSGMTPMAN